MPSPSELVRLGIPTRFGSEWPGRRCGALRRKIRIPCKLPALKGKTRCRLHGGHSTGPRTPEGKARSSRNGTKLGLYAQPGNPALPPGKQGSRWRGPKTGVDWRSGLSRVKL